MTHHRNESIRTWRCVVFWFVVVCAAQATADTLEVQIRTDPSLGSAVLRLGHLVEFHGAPVTRRRELESVEVCPAPRAGDRLVIDRNDIRRLLILAGVPGASIRFVGPARVTVSGRGDPRRPAALPVVSRRVEQAIARTWTDTTGGAAEAKVELVQADLPDFLDRYEVIDVNPTGSDPATLRRGAGRYEVVLARDDASRPYSVEVTAEVTPVVRAIVPVRPLSRGERIGKNDVREAELSSSQADSLARSGRLVTSLNEVLGKEAQRTLPAGKPIDRSAVRAPLVIKRREYVTVIARHGGLVARMAAVAMTDARLGEAVDLENPDSKERFTARAIGPGTAQIMTAPSGYHTSDEGGQP